MLLRLHNVLAQDQVKLVQTMLEQADFVDGKLSAGQVAKHVKQNEELSRGAVDMDRLNDIVMGSLLQHPDYRAGALPMKVAAPYYARYRDGMSYGDHVDDPIMHVDKPYRSDVSITVFLNDPDAYEGGELVIRSTFGEQAVKLSAGDAVMYPSSSVHHINPVSKGVRLVAVTWLQSLVRDPAKRELLYELYQVREKMLREQPTAEDSKKIDRTYVNLIRMWGEV
jgi:PKHD-type hydroxylase